MNLAELKALLAVPSRTYEETLMVAYLRQVLAQKGARVWSDRYNNVYAIKGSDAKPLPCLAAHIDTVQPLEHVTVVEDNGYLRGLRKGKAAGLGADDKTGIFVALQLMEHFDNIALMLFAAEELGMHGARNADPAFFEKVGYVIEFDCPSRHMLSYTVAGVRLFENRGEFITKAYPVLEKHGTYLWQNHPFTDVMQVRKRFPLSCLNLSSGYYNWHRDDEFIRLKDVELAIAQGLDLVQTLDSQRYPFMVNSIDESEPMTAIGGLFVPPPNPAE